MDEESACAVVGYALPSYVEQGTSFLFSFLGILSIAPLPGAQSDTLRQKGERTAIRLVAREGVILIRPG